MSSLPSTAMDTVLAATAAAVILLKWSMELKPGFTLRWTVRVHCCCWREP